MDNIQNTQQLFLLEVLVKTVVLGTTRPKCEIFGCNTHESNPLHVSIKFKNFKDIDISQKDFACENVVETDKISTFFDCGKSSLFSVTPKAFLQSLHKKPGTATVYTLPPDCNKRKTVGQADVNIDSFVEDFYFKVCTMNTQQPITMSSLETYDLYRRECSCKMVGNITLLIRLSCFGRSIVTEFQVKEGAKKTFLFKRGLNDETYQCKQCVIPFENPEEKHDDPINSACACKADVTKVPCPARKSKTHGKSKDSDCCSCCDSEASSKRKSKSKPDKCSCNTSTNSSYSTPPEGHGRRDRGFAPAKCACQSAPPLNAGCSCSNTRADLKSEETNTTSSRCAQSNCPNLNPEVSLRQGIPGDANGGCVCSMESPSSGIQTILGKYSSRERPGINDAYSANQSSLSPDDWCPCKAIGSQPPGSKVHESWCPCSDLEGCKCSNDTAGEDKKCPYKVLNLPKSTLETSSHRTSPLTSRFSMDREKMAHKSPFESSVGASRASKPDSCGCGTTSTSASSSGKYQDYAKRKVGDSKTQCPCGKLEGCRCGSGEKAPAKKECPYISIMKQFDDSSESQPRSKGYASSSIGDYDETDDSEHESGNEGCECLVKSKKLRLPMRPGYIKSIAVEETSYFLNGDVATVRMKKDDISCLCESCGNK